MREKSPLNQICFRCVREKTPPNQSEKTPMNQSETSPLNQSEKTPLNKSEKIPQNQSLAETLFPIKLLYLFFQNCQ